MTYNFLESLYSDIMSMLSMIVIKRQDLATINETLASARSFELYMACLNGSRYFYNFQTFDHDILIKYVPADMVIKCQKDTNLIPENVRPLIVNEQADVVVKTYIETNEYYRMINGQPRLDDYTNIYITDRPDIDPTIPVHKLSDDKISQLETSGYLDTLKEKYPDAEYLDYLGSNRVDIIKARVAKPFDILRLGPSSNGNTANMFRSEYYTSRRYVMATIYNRELFTTKTLYDPLMATMITCLAIRNTLVPNDAQYLNFEEILNVILESYGLLQYFKRFPFTIKKRIILALDKLLSVKGTDGVLIDICKLFSFDNFTANRYYLMKTPAKDTEGKIVFTGDPEKDYDLNFVKVDIRGKDINFSRENIVSYEAVTDNDYLWQLTHDQKLELLKSDFNLMMTKYIDIEAAYDLTKLVFEMCCFTNLLLYARYNLSKLYMANMYSTSGYSSVFTMIVFWLAGMAKRSNFDGNIVYDPPEIAQIMQFNYGDIAGTVKDIINKYELQIDVDGPILEGFNMTLAKPNGYITQNDIMDIYLQNRKLYNAILEEMAKTEDVRQYIALSQARDVLYTAAMEKNTFMKSDGTPANTYYDMLKDLDPMLAKKIDTAEDEFALNNVILYTLEKLEEMFNSDELQYLFMNTPSSYGTLLTNYLKMAINVFKASMVQLGSINVYFYISDHDPVRIIDHNFTHEKIHVNDAATFTETISTHETVYIDDTIGFADKPYVTTK